MKMNSHDFVHDNIKKTEYVDLMCRLGALGNGNGDGSKLISSYCYLLFRTSVIVLGYFIKNIEHCNLNKLNKVITYHSKAVHNVFI